MGPGEDFRDIWIQRASRQIDRFNSQELANSLWAVARFRNELRRQDLQGFLNAWLESSLPQIAEFNLEQLTSIIWSLGNLSRQGQITIDRNQEITRMITHLLRDEFRIEFFARDQSEITNLNQLELARHRWHDEDKRSPEVSKKTFKKSLPKGDIARDIPTYRKDDDDRFDDDSSFGGKNRKNTWANILRGKTSCEKKQPSWADRVKQSSKGKSGSNKHGMSHGEALSFRYLPFPSINTGTSTLSSSFFGALLFSQMVVRAK